MAPTRRRCLWLERCAEERPRRGKHVGAVYVVAQQLVAAHVALRGEPVQRGRSREASRSVTETDFPSKALICMLYRSSVPANCCTSLEIEPKAPNLRFRPAAPRLHLYGHGDRQRGGSAAT